LQNRIAGNSRKWKKLSRIEIKTQAIATKALNWLVEPFLQQREKISILQK